MQILGTVGEPINPEAWRWYNSVVGEGTRPIVDTWWQVRASSNLHFSCSPGVEWMHGVVCNHG